MAYDKDNGTAAIYREPMPPQKSCTSYRVYKILSIVYAVIFFLIGAILLALGVWVLTLKQDYESIHDVLTSPTLLAVAVGAVMVLTAVLGVVAAAASKLWPLRIFLGIVIVVFLVQVAIGIVAYICREQTIEDIDEHLDFAIRRYNDNKQIRIAVDKVQTKFRCCGLTNLTDWNINTVYSCDGNTALSCHVPDSCCKTKSDGCGLLVNSNAKSTVLKSLNVYINGCRWEFLGWLESNFDAIGATALAFAILHILGIFVIYMFITKVEDRYRLFKYRKRFYPN